METKTTLRDLRLAKSLSHEEVVSYVAANAVGVRCKSERASALWEFRGIQNADILAALASLYKVSDKDIRQASRNSREFGGPPMHRGRPARNITNSAFPP